LQSKEPECSKPFNERTLLKLLKTAPPKLDTYSKYISFGKDRYQRNRVFKNEHIKILIMCWAKGQCSPIHNHSSSWCGIRVLSAIASEIRFTEGSFDGSLLPVSQGTYEPGSITVARDDDIHCVANFHDAPLITLHCHAPPLEMMDTFHVVGKHV
jgi:cysteine dioxygenase